MKKPLTKTASDLERKIKSLFLAMYNEAAKQNKEEKDMTIIPMRWLPYILAIAGVCGLLSGEIGVLGSAILIVLGALGIYLMVKTKAASGGQNGI